MVTEEREVRLLLRDEESTRIGMPEFWRIDWIEDLLLGEYGPSSGGSASEAVEWSPARGRDDWRVFGELSSAPLVFLRLIEFCKT